METLSIKCDSTLLDKIGEFNLSEKQIKIFTALSWANLLEIKDLMTSLRNSQSRLGIQVLIVFLLKLRTRNSNKLLASTLNIDNEHSISEYSERIIESFGKDVLPLRFGLNSVNRDKSYSKPHNRNCEKIV